jgi:hypothetical protein
LVRCRYHDGKEDDRDWLSEEVAWDTNPDGKPYMAAYRLAAQPASEQVGMSEANAPKDLQELLGRLRAVGTESFSRKESIIGIITEAADAIEALLADLAAEQTAVRELHDIATDLRADLARKDAALLMIQCLTGDEKVNAEARQALETKAGGAS